MLTPNLHKALLLCANTSNFKMLKHPVNIAVVISSFIVIGLLTVVSFLGAWAYDEGTMSNSILASLFKIFRFPTHTFFAEFFNHSAANFYLGLLLNTVFFSFLTERLFSLVKDKK